MSKNKISFVVSAVVEPGRPRVLLAVQEADLAELEAPGHPAAGAQQELHLLLLLQQLPRRRQWRQLVDALDRPHVSLHYCVE